MRRIAVLLCIALLAGCASAPADDDTDVPTTPTNAVTPTRTVSDPFVTPTPAQASPEATATTPTAPASEPMPCPVDVPAEGPRSGRPVHVYVGSEMGRTTCVRVELDDRLVLARTIESSASGLPADPFPYHDTRIDATSMEVSVEESIGGKKKTQRFELPPEVFVIVTITADDIRIEVADRAPP